MKKIVFAAVLSLFLVACSGSSYNSHVDSLPLTAGESTYYLDSITVNLIDSHDASAADSPYLDQAELTDQFANQIKQHLADNGILSPTKEAADALLEVVIQYQRTYVWESNSLGRPKVSHAYSIYQDGKLLVNDSVNNYTTKYSYFKNTAVDIEITAGGWDEEDEPKDTDLISEMIVKDIAQVGD